MNEAHQQGLKSVRTKVVQVPTVDNGMVTICFAEVETERGTFTGVGDASPGNVSRMIAPPALRMAEARAKARALRDAVNVGMAALEELGPDVEVEQPARKPTAAPVAIANQRQAVGYRRQQIPAGRAIS